MRALLLATVALIAVPAAAQDHSRHAASPPAQDHSGHAAPTAAAAPEDHSANAASADSGPGQAGHEHTRQPGEAGKPADHGTMEPGEIEPGAVEHAMEHGAMEHGGHEAIDPAAPTAAPPPRAFEGPRHAADTIFGSAAMSRSRAENEAMDRITYGTVMLERLEARVAQGRDHYLWDAQAWYGSDSDKLWLKSEGEGVFGDAVDTAEVQALWSHAIGPFFDLQAGGRYDIEPDGRAHAAVGVHGLAPYKFEVDAAAFLSDEGDLTARIEAEYDQRITQRLIVQPRVEIALAAQDIPERGIGAGVSSVETGLRLRFEFAREFAPYVGIGYEAKFGDTADFARAAGEDPDGFSFLLGLRAWF